MSLRRRFHQVLRFLRSQVLLRVSGCVQCDQVRCLQVSGCLGALRSRCERYQVRDPSGLELRTQVSCCTQVLLQVFLARRIMESACTSLIALCFQVRVRARRGTEAGPATRGQTPMWLFSHALIDASLRL